MTDGRQASSRDTIHSFDHFLAIHHHQPADGDFFDSSPTAVHSFTFPLSEQTPKTTTTFSVSWIGPPTSASPRPERRPSFCCRQNTTHDAVHIYTYVESYLSSMLWRGTTRCTYLRCDAFFFLSLSLSLYYYDSPETGRVGRSRTDILGEGQGVWYGQDPGQQAQGSRHRAAFLFLHSLVVAGLDWAGRRNGMGWDGIQDTPQLEHLCFF